MRSKGGGEVVVEGLRGQERKKVQEQSVGCRVPSGKDVSARSHCSLPPSLSPSLPPYCCISCQTPSRHWTKTGELSTSAPGPR